METVIDYADVELLHKEMIVLGNVNLKVHTGEIVYLTGRVGSGKTTLLKSFYGDVPVYGGVANVLGRDMTQLKRKQIPFLRREIGIVFQDFRLLTDRTVGENLKFVLKATGWKDKTDIEDRVEEVLRNVGMRGKAYKMIHELSGGEQQRTVIARAMLNRPKLILADEPTGNLDSETGGKIIQLLHVIANSGTAVVIATHNHRHIEDFPARQIVCQDKRVVDN